MTTATMTTTRQVFPYAVSKAPAIIMTVCTILAFAMFARGAAWDHEVLSAENLAEHVVDGRFLVLPGGGPDGEDVVLFDDPENPRGSITIDLSDVDLSHYDQIQFDVAMEGGPVDIAATLRGYPDDHHGRRWYAFKRFQPLDEWTDVRLDFDLDDDLSRPESRFDEPERSLTLGFSRPESDVETVPRAKVRRVRLIRSPIGVTVDYRRTDYAEQDGLSFTYPVRVENRTDRALDIRLKIQNKTLEHFSATLDETARTLQPGEQWAATATVSIGPEYHDLPTGTVERALVQATTASFPDYTAIPVRGYRPVYLLGVTPPPTNHRGIFFDRLKAEAERLSAGALTQIERNLDHVIEQPPSDKVPVYEMLFRCPECNSLMRVERLGVIHCYSRDVSEQCPRHMQRVEITPEDSLYGPMLSHYHPMNLRIARSMALAWLKTGDARFGEKALEILQTYQDMFDDLPMVSPASTGYHCRLTNANLFERHNLERMVEAYVILRDGGFGEPAALEAMARNMIAETLYNVNLHHYGFGASQVDMSLQTMKAAVILGQWAYLADALGGDSGVQRLLDRTFDADGIGGGGGDYGRQAANQIRGFGEFLAMLGIDVNRERIDQIQRNTAMFGLIPPPEGFEWETTVLEHNGFTVLVNGEGATRRRASINWGSSRERGAHDHLTTVFHGADDAELLLRTRRIAWGHPYSFFSYQSVSQNIPVVDEGNISRRPLVQEYLRDDAAAAGVIIADTPGRPAYPDARLKRALVLFEGCLLVLDRVTSDTGERQFDFPVYGLLRFAAMPDGMQPFEGTLGESQAYRHPRGLRTMPLEDGQMTVDWADAERGLRLHMIGEDDQVYTGISNTDWRAVERDFLMFRTRGASATAAFLYESTVGEHPRVERFERLDVHGARDDQAIAYAVAFADGRVLRVLISLDGGAYRIGNVAVDGQARIAIGAAE